MMNVRDLIVRAIYCRRPLNVGLLPIRLYTVVLRPSLPRLTQEHPALRIKVPHEIDDFCLESRSKPLCCTVGFSLFCTVRLTCSPA
ncbi:hypothetical protein LY76DRAFT_286271 [Colletotrichum caudatum]|nr:hypothetical protein LY76DRAFT_286271 [Colletotrichum caudatum]